MTISSLPASRLPVAAPREPRPALSPAAAAPGSGPNARSPLPAPEAGAEPSAFARLVRGLGREVGRGEQLVRGAMESSRAGSMGPAELIALQAGVYRYSEAVDLAAKLVDHATAGLRTVVQGQ